MRGKPRVDQIGALPPAAQAALTALADVQPFTGEASPARVLVTNAGKGASAAAIEALAGPALVAVFGVGLDRVDLAHARARGATVTNTPDALTDDVADFAVLLLLAAARGLASGDAFVRSGGWAKGPAPLGRSLRGRTVGIVGYGRIGRAVASRLAALGMAVRAWNRTPFASQTVRYEPDLRALAKACDALVLTVAASAETRRLVDAEVLAALGPEGILVNVARGEVVDEAALAAALESGALGFAALDVFENEPFPHPGLIASPRTLLQPHQGSATRETREAMGAMVVESVRAFLEGRPPPHSVPLKEEAP